MILKAKQTLLMTGDSITDCERLRPLGKPDWWLGNGYVAMVNALLNARYPETPVRVLNTGIGGNRVIDLADRWEDDVLAHKPDWVSIMIGINDVWRHFDNELEQRQVSLEEFEQVLTGLVRKTRRSISGIILITPFFIEGNPEDPMRKMMDLYSAAVKKIAQANDTVFVDTQDAFDAFLKHRPTQALCGDRVHPNPIGHMIIARAFLNAIEFAW